MRIAIAGDHNGLALKAHLIRRLAARGHEVVDFWADIAANPPEVTPSGGATPGAPPRQDWYASALVDHFKAR